MKSGREAKPTGSSLSFIEIAEGIHDKYYSDMPFGDFLRQFLKIFTNSISTEFVLIPAGRFTKGRLLYEFGKHDYEDPQVEISKAFYMGKYEVTQGQWKEVMGNNPSLFKDCGDDCPVERVSWDDVQDFIRRLNQREGTDKYRLPTAAEWEYACRAGSQRQSAFSFGSDVDRLADYAWYDANSGGRTHPVGKKTPNAWGLYDMHGNVWEWCQDWLVGESHQTFWGGSWIDNPKYLWCASGAVAPLVSRDPNVGFRLVLGLEP